MGVAEAQAKADAAQKAYRENDQSIDAMRAAQEAQLDLLREKNKAGRRAKNKPIRHTVISIIVGVGVAWIVWYFW